MSIDKLTSPIQTLPENAEDLAEVLSSFTKIKLDYFEDFLKQGGINIVRILHKPRL